VLDALRARGTHAFNELFNRRDAGNHLVATTTTTLQVCGDDPPILSWPWEALYDAQTCALVAHRFAVERRLNCLPALPTAADLPNGLVSILVVVCRPFKNDVRYRSIAHHYPSAHTSN